MGSSSKRQTTMAKMARERALQERRALKQQKKEERKAARLAEAEGTAPVGEAEGVDPLEPGETAAETDEGTRVVDAVDEADRTSGEPTQTGP